MQKREVVVATGLLLGLTAASALFVPQLMRARITVRGGPAAPVTESPAQALASLPRQPFPAGGATDAAPRVPSRERLVDSYGDGDWDPGENFTDTNGNGRWDPGFAVVREGGQIRRGSRRMPPP